MDTRLVVIGNGYVPTRNVDWIARDTVVFNKDRVFSLSVGVSRSHTYSSRSFQYIEQIFISLNYKGKVTLLLD